MKIGSHNQIQISKIFDQTAFESDAFIIHFFADFRESKVSGIDVTAAKITSETTSAEIHKFSQTKLAQATATSTQTYVKTKAYQIVKYQILTFFTSL